MIQGYRIVQVPKITDDRGSLSFVELGQFLDFAVKRVYWLYEMKKERGAHAHKTLKQFIFCAKGSVDFVLNDGENEEIVKLDEPNKGLVIEQPLWREIKNFSEDAAVIVLASDTYSEADYIRSYEEFKTWQKMNRS